MVNTYAVQWGGCRFESLWGFGFFLKGAHYEVDYSGKKTYLAGLQCTLTSSCAKRGHLGSLNVFRNQKLQKNARGYPLIEFDNFRKKVAQCRKKPKVGPFGLASTFGSTFWDSLTYILLQNIKKLEGGTLLRP